MKDDLVDPLKDFLANEGQSGFSVGFEAERSRGSHRRYQGSDRTGKETWGVTRVISQKNLGTSAVCQTLGEICSEKVANIHGIS